MQRTMPIIKHFSFPILTILFLALLCLNTLGAVRAQDVPTPVTVTVRPGPHQTFQGFGTGQFDGTYHSLSPERRALLARLIYSDLHMKFLRLWWSMREYSPAPGETHPEHFVAAYVASHIIADAKANGVTTLLLGPFDPPLYMLENPAQGDSHLKASEVKNYAALMADFIKILHDRDGVTIQVTGIANEPPWFTPETMAAEVAALRTALDLRGLTRVGIIAHESPNNDGVSDDFLKAMKNSAAAWHGLLGIATHSYNMSARREEAELIAGTGKQFWITEAGAGGAEGPNDGRYAASLAARYFNDMNHGVTHWMWFLGAVDVSEWPDSSDNSQRLIEFKADRPADWYIPFLPYYYLRRIAGTFDGGAVFRQSVSTEGGDMLWTEAPKPPLVAAAARNPDGTWGLGLINYTSDRFADWETGGFHAKGQAGRFFRITLQVPELAKSKNTVFRVWRSSETMHDIDEGTVVIQHGTLTLTLAPLEMLTLRSLPGKK